MTVQDHETVEAGVEFDAFEAEQDGQFALLIGGKNPTTTKVRLYGGAIEIEPPVEGFKKGGRYVLRVEVLCKKASFTDETDHKTGQVVGCSDERGLKITGASLSR